jgi:hypothetical protein
VTDRRSDVPDDEADEVDEVRLDGEGNPIEDEPFTERVIDQWPLALVLAGVVTGLVVVAWGDFRVGALMVSASVVFGGALRAVLPRDTAGLLVVRSTPIDLATYFTLGIALTALSILVPAPV